MSGDTEKGREPWRKTHVPYVWTDGGPWAEHDMPCAVCWKKPAVIDVGTAIFHPCWEYQRVGWRLTKKKWRRARV